MLMTESAESVKEEKEEAPDELADPSEPDSPRASRKASAKHAAITDPIAGFEAKRGNWNNVADIVRLGILASHKKHDRAKTQFYNLDIRLDGMLDKMHKLQHKLDESLEQLSKAAAAAATHQKRRSTMESSHHSGSDRPSAAEDVDKLQDMPRASTVASTPQRKTLSTFGAAAQKAVQMSRNASPVNRRTGQVASRLNMPPDITAVEMESDSDSSLESDGRITEEERQKLLLIAPMERKLTDAGLKLNVLKNQFGTLETKHDQLGKFVDALEVKIADELNIDAIAQIVKKVFSEELHEKVERIALKITQVALEPLEGHHEILRGEVISSCKSLKELKLKTQMTDARLKILEEEVLRASSCGSSEDGKQGLSGSEARLQDCEPERGLAASEAWETAQAMEHVPEIQRTDTAGTEQGGRRQELELLKTTAMPQQVQVAEEPETERERGTTSVQTGTLSCRAAVTQVVSVASDNQDTPSQISPASVASPEGEDHGSSMAILNALKGKAQRFRQRLKKKHAGNSNLEEVSRSVFDRQLTPPFDRQLTPPFDRQLTPPFDRQLTSLSEQQRHQMDLDQNSKYMAALEAIDGLDGRFVGLEQQCASLVSELKSVSECQPEMQQRLDDLQSTLSLLQSEIRQLEAWTQETLDDATAKMKAGIEEVVDAGAKERARLGYQLSVLFPRLGQRAAGQLPSDSKHTGHGHSAPAVTSALSVSEARLFALDSRLDRLENVILTGHVEQEHRRSLSPSSPQARQSWQARRRLSSSESAEMRKLSKSRNGQSSRTTRILSSLNQEEDDAFKLDAARARAATEPNLAATEESFRVGDAKDDDHDQVSPRSPRMPAGADAEELQNLSARPSSASQSWQTMRQAGAEELPALAVRRHASALSALQEDQDKRMILRRLLVQQETQIRESSEATFGSSVRNSQGQSMMQSLEPDAGHPGLVEWRNGDSEVTEMPQVLIEDTVASHATMLRQFPPLSRSFPAGGEASSGNVLLMAGGGPSNTPPASKETVQKRPDTARRPKSSGQYGVRTAPQARPADKLPRPSTAGSRR